MKNKIFQFQENQGFSGPKNPELRRIFLVFKFSKKGKKI